MATTTTKPKDDEKQEAPQSARERYRSRYSAAHPDMNLDDEEAFYTQANANLDELEGFRESNRLLGEAFDKTPLLAGIVLAAKDGENPFTYLAERIGPDMDIRELANNPDFSKKMGEALLAFQAKETDTKKKADEAKKAEKQFLQSGFKVIIANFSGNLVKLGETNADEICLDLEALKDEGDVESIFSQAVNARLNLTCEGITSAKKLADIKRYGCLEGRGEHLYPMMSRSEYENLLSYPSID